MEIAREIARSGETSCSGLPEGRAREFGAARESAMTELRGVLVEIEDMLPWSCMSSSWLWKQSAWLHDVHALAPEPGDAGVNADERSRSALEARAIALAERLGLSLKKGHHHAWAACKPLLAATRADGGPTVAVALRPLRELAAAMNAQQIGLTSQPAHVPQRPLAAPHGQPSARALVERDRADDAQMADASERARHEPRMRAPPACTRAAERPREERFTSGSPARARAFAPGSAVNAHAPPVRQRDRAEPGAAPPALAPDAALAPDGRGATGAAGAREACAMAASAAGGLPMGASALNGARAHPGPTGSARAADGVSSEPSARSDAPSDAPSDTLSDALSDALSGALSDAPIGLDADAHVGAHEPPLLCDFDLCSDEAIPSPPTPPMRAGQAAGAARARTRHLPTTARPPLPSRTACNAGAQRTARSFCELGKAAIAVAGMGSTSARLAAHALAPEQPDVRALWRPLALGSALPTPRAVRAAAGSGAMAAVASSMAAASPWSWRRVPPSPSSFVPPLEFSEDEGEGEGEQGERSDAHETETPPPAPAPTPPPAPTPMAGEPTARLPAQRGTDVAREARERRAQARPARAPDGVASCTARAAAQAEEAPAQSRAHRACHKWAQLHVHIPPAELAPLIVAAPAAADGDTGGAARDSSVHALGALDHVVAHAAACARTPTVGVIPGTAGLLCVASSSSSPFTPPPHRAAPPTCALSPILTHLPSEPPSVTGFPSDTSDGCVLWESFRTPPLHPPPPPCQPTHGQPMECARAATGSGAHASVRTAGARAPSDAAEGHMPDAEPPVAALAVPVLRCLRGKRARQGGSQVRWPRPTRG